MNQELNRIVIVGGGSAGWLTAGILAAQLQAKIKESSLEILLVESPDIATVGVGEGTWPSMRTTLQKIGVRELDFIRQCDVSFKQGSKFINWSKGEGEFYYHPFSLPENYADTNLAFAWQEQYFGQVDFAHSVCPQSAICDLNLAPKQSSTPDFAFNLNYGYHLNAGKFSEFLRRHCVENLGVNHCLDKIIAIKSHNDGYINGLETQKNGMLTGDLFVDCSGFAALLIGQHYDIPFIEKRDILFNDRAIAAQVQYSEKEAPIASCTLSIAQDAGWVWDIALPNRRGIGYTYASEHASQKNAEETLRAYIASAFSEEVAENTSVRSIKFNPGYRSELWHKNCVAIGISAGFIEPLEASALVMIERSAQLLAEQLPVNTATMPILATRFNTVMQYHWEKIIDFLKLHYVLSQRRDSDYWRRHVAVESQTSSLQESLALWRHQPPWKYDTYRIDELFPSASYQYVLFGMNYPTQYKLMNQSQDDYRRASFKAFDACQSKLKQLQQGLTSNRALLNGINIKAES